MILSILRQTPDWVAVDKPPGMVVVPARQEDPHESLWRTLERQLSERLWVVHRLDRDTSGIVLFARNSQAHRALSIAFEQRRVQKTYLAFTRGSPPQKKGLINQPLHPARKGKMRPAAADEAGAVAAVTEYRLVQQWRIRSGPIALLDLHPRTGRHHQIRVHLRFVCIPLLVDPVYGRADRFCESELGAAGDRTLCDRTTLHASELVFPAPGSDEQVSLRSPLWPDLGALRDALNEGASSPTPGTASDWRK